MALRPCRICGHVHDPEDGLFDVHGHVGLGACPCPGEPLLTCLVDAATAANDAMRLHNRGGMSWLELDGTFARLELVLRDVRAQQAARPRLGSDGEA